MATLSPTLPSRVRRLPSGRVPRAAIQSYVQRIVAKFQPTRVMLFGSHASGKPTADSDVDLLVVMPAADMVNQAIRILLSLPAPFPADVIVRTPEFVAQRQKGNDYFVKDIMERGIVLYEAADQRMAGEGRSRFAKRTATRRSPADRS